VKRDLLALLEQCTDDDLEKVRRLAQRLIRRRSAAAIDLPAAIRAELAALDDVYQCGGRVPVDLLRKSFPDVAREALDAAVLEAERRGQIRLEMVPKTFFYAVLS
jgi:hypothetical protein